VRPPRSDTLADVAAETGAPYLDAAALLDGAIAGVVADPGLRAERERVDAIYGKKRAADHPQLYLYLPDACHPSLLGHRLVAEATARVAAGLLGDL
jgi:hypothetical protein